ncbi:YceI family protein [Brumimicrobium aurantiacum]|uniref:YceI family protein n=1 Tax=Brumimicrobium aurantiacum TaxID=1737063 RepID=A0A3E1EW12_9FLAO|nr:YceI family protein [Brumimicrobium aurantiacum]RFC53746.1 YceI family protein [Brumimicrobium aurantiacum]
METISATIALITGSFTVIGLIKNKSTAILMVSAFILGLLSLILSRDFMLDGSNANHLLAYLLISVLTISFAVGIFAKQSSKKLFALIPIALSGVFYIYPQIAEHSFLNQKIDDVLVLSGIAFVSALAPVIIFTCDKVVTLGITKITTLEWNDENKHSFHNALTLVFIGIIAVIGNFLVGKISLLVAATFMLSSAFVTRNKFNLKSSTLLTSGSTLFLISSAYILLEKYGFQSLDLKNGEVLEGLFMAGFLAVIYSLFINLGQKSKGNWQFLPVLKSILAPIIILFLIGFAYTQLERLGGMLTLTSYMIGLGLITMIFSALKNNDNLVGLHLISLGAILLFSPYLKPVQQSSGIDLNALGIEASGEENNQSEQQNLSYHEKLDEPNGKVFPKEKSTWKIDEKSSKVFFELGPEDGRTKGEFTNIKGELAINETHENANIKVTIPVKHISTYNSMRDESLMDKEYFHEEKFPEITFESDQFTKKDDAYLLEGTFNMLGYSNPLEVTLKLVGIGTNNGKEVMVLWGKSSVDKTQYGMPSSAKVGDIVDFHFEVQLNK